MKITEEKIDKINKGKSYVASGSRINLIFLIIGIIETILIAMILLDMEIFSIWFILILIVSAISVTYIVFIVFATIISMLDQLTLNNELLIMTIDQKEENTAKSKPAPKYIKKMNDKVLLDDASNKNKSNNNKEGITGVSPKVGLFEGVIINKHSDTTFEFENDKGASYIIRIKNIFAIEIGTRVKIEGSIKGTESFRSAIGTIEKKVIKVESIKVL